MARLKNVAAGRSSLGIGAVLSLAVGLMLYASTDQAIERDAQSRFNNLTHTLQAALNARIKSYADVLRGAASLFLTTPDLNHDQFHRYVEGLNLNAEFPGIETVNFALHFTEQRRPAFEASMRKRMAEVKAGYPEFKIFPPGRRAEYTALTYIEPIRTWSDKFGLDLQARASVAQTLEQSRDTGEMSTSGTRVKLRLDANGLGMRMPVYSAGSPLRTVEQRRAAYVGSVGIGFSVRHLAQSVLAEVPMPQMRLVISGLSPDEVPLGPRGTYRRFVFYDNMPRSDSARDTASLFQASLPIGVGGRGWDAEFSLPRQVLYSDLDRYAPWLALFAGSTGTMLLYALFQTLSSSRRRALELATEMTGELRASEAKLQESNENLRRLAAHSDNIKEVERKRIAREIHDALGQNLLALRIEADLLASRTAQRHPRLHARAEWTLKQIDATIKSVRQIINDLRPNVLDLGLVAAVDWQIAEFKRLTGIECNLTLSHPEIPADDRCATALFRILQESLTNVSRHSGATHVWVNLQMSAGGISMSVRDNGVGLRPGRRYKPGSFGLAGIEERVRILGGKFSISAEHRSGTVIQLTIPVGDNPHSTAAPASGDAPAPSPVIV